MPAAHYQETADPRGLNENHNHNHDLNNLFKRVATRPVLCPPFP
jgi:hypothetical protein